MSFIVGVRTDDNKDFLIEGSGLVVIKNESKLFPAGSRVRVVNHQKSYSKYDELAETIGLGKWSSGLKIPENAAGIVLGSAPHPIYPEIMVVGFRSDHSQDFLIQEEGLSLAPDICVEFPANTRVRIQHAEKVYSKMDDAAKEMALSKWTNGAKPKGGEVGFVLSSTKHPVDENTVVVGVRTEAGNDFVLQVGAIVGTPNESEKFPFGTRVWISNPDKLYTKMDDFAKELNLGKWVAGQKPVIKKKPPTPEIEETEPNGDNVEPPAKKKKLEVNLATVGEVRGSKKHPLDESIIVLGIRTDGGQEYLVAEEAVEQLHNEGPFKEGTRVRIAEPGKLFPKWDDKAKQMGLTRWTEGAKPTILFGKIMTSFPK